MDVSNAFLLREMYDLSDSGKYEQAIECINEYINNQPEDFLGFYNRGVIFESMSQDTDALLDYDTALKFEPNNMASLTNRGNVKLRLKMYKEAIEDYTLALKYCTNCSITFYDRGYAYYLSQEYSDAILDFDLSIELDSERVGMN